VSDSLNLTSSAEEAAQMLAALDPGETFSTTMLTTILGVANNLWSNWWQEQVLALQELISEQAKALQIFVDGQARETAPLVAAYTLAAGSYIAPTFTAGSTFTSSAPQFPDTVSNISVPSGYGRAFQLSLAIEIAPIFGFQPSQSLMAQAAEARAAASPVPGKVPVPGSRGMQAIPPPGQPPVPASAGGE
jgi:hypothetical protein